MRDRLDATLSERILVLDGAYGTAIQARDLSDADYRGELLVTMYVLPFREPHIVHNGDRVAQLVISRSADVVLMPSQELSATARDAGGHGSTGR